MLRLIATFCVFSFVLIGCRKPASVTATPKDESEAMLATADEDGQATIDSSPNEVAATAATEEASDASAEEDDHGPGLGRGMGRGMGRGRGGGFRPDMTTIHAMFDASDKITRTVKNLPNGAEAVTESDDESVTNLIQEHVPSMELRVNDDNPLPPMTFHPVFVELIKNADKYTFDFEHTEKGIKVTYTADEPFVVMLVQEHAKLVSRFLKNGMSEIHKPYKLPTVDERSPKERAAAAKRVLFKRLSGRLAEVMQSKGPAAAIEVCSNEASQFAKQVGEEYHCVIGRTSHKLRNASNKSPEWAKSLVENATTEDTVVELTENRTGVLFPIRLEAKCLLCHGRENQLAADVKLELAKLYPNDEATGFQVGDLRGWFWVEVDN